MSTATPRLIQRWAARAFCCSGPLALLTMGSWAAGVWEARPHVTMMIYMLALAVAMVAAVVAALASCHMHVASAFAAGLQVGQGRQLVHSAPSGPPDLRVVE